MRYVDLVVNPHVKSFYEENQIVHCYENVFNRSGLYGSGNSGFTIDSGGAAARPFITHHNSLDIPLYIQELANELYLEKIDRWWI